MRLTTHAPTHPHPHTKLQASLVPLHLTVPPHAQYSDAHCRHEGAAHPQHSSGEVEALMVVILVTVDLVVVLMVVYSTPTSYSSLIQETD